MGRVGFKLKQSDISIGKQMGIKKFPFLIKDEEGRLIYCENEKGYWSKSTYDEHGNRIWFENSKGFWCLSVFNQQGLETYCETSGGYWCKSEYDEHGILRYYENSDGKVNGHHLQKQPVKITKQQVANMFNIEMKRVTFVE